MKPDRTYTPARGRGAARTPGPPGSAAVCPTPGSRLARSRVRNGGGGVSSSSSTNTSTESGAGADEVAVYCRLRPWGDPDDPGRSVQKVDGHTVRLVPPESSRNYINGKQTDYSFRAVFGGDASTKEVFDGVAKPLVKDLLQEKNGLLFTYGVTGSGKTHTMQGTSQDGGVMSRAIDVIFNSLGDRLVARRHMIVPDRLNDFQVQSLADAAMVEQEEMIRGRTQGGRYGRAGTADVGPDQNLSNRMVDSTSLSEDVEDNRNYAVFISYCEIYNTYIYDLLEDTRDPVTGKPKYDTKFLREDSYGNMFVLGCTEVEVRSPKEALEAFYKGQRRRRVAQTQLNHESSRSHAIFNIRLVKTHPAGDGEIDLDKPCMVSQLALVDLAGSERTNRTGNKGQALREAGRINNSLMNLRRCIERLRENQKSGKTGAVPYRDDKLTHLFRNYFEGIGCVKMIVCVNPREQDFDENVNVMQFAEMAAEVHIERVDPVEREFVLTPGQRRAKQAIEDALKKARKSDHGNNPPNPMFSPIYSLGPEYPSLESAEDEEMMDKMEAFLEKRITTRNTLQEDFIGKEEHFRSKLVEMETELIVLREENARLKCSYGDDRRRIKDLESRLVNAESANTSLQRKITAFNDAKVTLENELDEKELLLNQQKRDQKKTTKKYRQHLAMQEQVNSELAQRLQEQHEQQQTAANEKARLKAVRSIVNGTPAHKTGASDPNVASLGSVGRKLLVPVRSSPDVSMVEETPKRGRRSLAVANPRHRRSKSAGELWVDHQPARPVPLNTVMQPKLSKRRSVTKVTEKEILDGKVSKYCLTTQTQDTDGELETKVYKADVIPTSTGGRQVVFDDVEVLKQESPSPRRTRRSKRSFEEFSGVSNRIAALEDRLNALGSSTPGPGDVASGYSSKSKKYRV